MTAGPIQVVEYESDIAPFVGDAVILINDRPYDIHIEAFELESESDEERIWNLEYTEGLRGESENVLFGGLQWM
jgi:hypothetical protein